MFVWFNMNRLINNISPLHEYLVANVCVVTDTLKVHFTKAPFRSDLPLEEIAFFYFV